MAHKHVDLKVEKARTRHRLGARDVLRGFESRHHIEESKLLSFVPAASTSTGSLVPRTPGVVKRILLSIGTRTDRD